MSTTQFAMVEELAFLIKDNLRSKHLVLSMEESFINYLQDQAEDNPNLDGSFELEPMDPYNRLLLHRLADIFGFAHASIGEGDGRHIVLERCPETAIPAILVSDILSQYDNEPHACRLPPELLRRDLPSVSRSNPPSLCTLREREAAYEAARERIFAVDVNESDELSKQKPRSVPVVARRMIAHALGKKFQNHGESTTNCKVEGLPIISSSNESEVGIKFGKESSNQASVSLRCGGKIAMKEQFCHNDVKPIASSGTATLTSPVKTNDLTVTSCANGATRITSKKEFSKEQQLGAAKRMFVNALGLPSSKAAAPSRWSKTNGLCTS